MAVVDLPQVARQALLEIKECQPFVMGIMSRGYDWVPIALPPCVSTMFPWTRHYKNPHVLSDALGRLVGCRRCQWCAPAPRSTSLSELSRLCGARPRLCGLFGCVGSLTVSTCVFEMAPFASIHGPAQAFVDRRRSMNSGAADVEADVSHPRRELTAAQRRAMTLFGRVETNHDNSAPQSAQVHAHTSAGHADPVAVAE